MKKTNSISAAIGLLILVLFAWACVATDSSSAPNRNSRSAQPFVSASPTAQSVNQNGAGIRPRAARLPKTAPPPQIGPQSGAPPIVATTPTGQAETSDASQRRVSSSPSGATAQCRDGSYSYSQHHQGTCSHHGGVAQWLD